VFDGDTWDPKNISVIGNADGYEEGSDDDFARYSSYVSHGKYHGGLHVDGDGSEETYTISFDWNGTENGDELVPMDFNRGLVIVENASKGNVTANVSANAGLYNFYGIFSKSGDQSNNNAYYSSVGSGNWATQQANALDQGTGSHMAFIQTDDENNFIFQACTFIDADIWIGGTDGEDTEAGEGTWVWKDNSETVFGTGAGEDFINADGFESFWNSGEPNDAGEGEDYAQYYYNRKKWNDLSGTQSMKTIIEIESEELNKFKINLRFH
jgi:hypothetical protein